MKQLLVTGILTVFSVYTAFSSAQEDELQISPNLATIFKDGTPTSLLDLKAMQDHVVKLTKKVMPAVVGVRVGQASGSGVIISKDGYVLTAGHVVQRPNIDCQIILPSGKILKGKTLGMESGKDSGLMKITEKGTYPYLEMGNSKDVEKGQWIIALGHPGGFDPKRTPPLRVGRVYGRSRTSRMIQTDCVLVGGDSGGPLFDMSGKVIGIHSRINASTRDGQFVGNFHVPVNIYAETFDKLAAGENIGKASTGKRPSLGFSIQPDQLAPTIKSLVKDAPAEKAGLKVGDVIVEIDGIRTRTKTALGNAMLKKKTGDKVKIKVKRGDKELEVTAELRQ